MPPIENVLALRRRCRPDRSSGPERPFRCGSLLGSRSTRGRAQRCRQHSGVCHIVLVAVGVGVIIAQWVVLFTVIKYAGAAYLVYLGVQAIRHRNDTGVETVAAYGHRARRTATSTHTPRCR